jgi:hypothetical protein
VAKLTVVRRGNSSSEQESEDVEYQREQGGEGDTATLESVLLSRKGNGWQVTVTHDRNGRPSRQVEHFDSYEAAHDYCDPAEDKEEGK